MSKNPSKSHTEEKASKVTNESRPPVVVVMGHVDHGKSTLLDYVRKTNIVDREVGGITQRMSAYEVIHKATNSDGKKEDKHITFLDTPGHESFTAIRSRGANAADIAILIVSAEDGVKPQTLDAYKEIKAAALPYLVGISKVDKPNANIDRVKLSLAENEIYVEGYGGTIPFVPFSGKTGQGIDDLLDMILLTAEVEDFSAQKNVPAECLVIESNRDKVRGTTATLIVKNGTLKSGSFLVAGKAMSPVRIMENFAGKAIKEAIPSMPVRIVGWDSEPEVGGMCFSFSSKKEAEKYIEEENEKASNQKDKSNLPSGHSASFGQNIGVGMNAATSESETSTVPLIIKADTSGSIEAIKYEISKLKIDRVNLRIVQSGIGDIGEHEIKSAIGIPGTIIIGFTVKVDGATKRFADQNKIIIHTFDIIYKMTEWLEAEAKERAPKIEIEEQKGVAKILKFFSSVRDKQVIGARVESGVISFNDEIRIMRRENEIARGRVRELQQMKSKVGSVDEGKEFGALLESKIEIAPGDKIEAFHTVIK
ncbi:MAG: translation initiation factor IF-2 [Candidatus Pacebacteria bacterium]|nr:translation initiation factor IF-2 [Candidatus Paceibacterota bacterium]